MEKTVVCSRYYIILARANSKLQKSVPSAPIIVTIMMNINRNNS